METQKVKFPIFQFSNHVHCNHTIHLSLKITFFAIVKDTMYMGGSPLFNEMTGESTDRYEHLKKKFPNEPWTTNKAKQTKKDTTTETAGSIKELILFVGNAAICIMWVRVFLVYLQYGITDMDQSICIDTLQPRIIHALYISGIELLNSILGLTKSKPHQVLLFSSVRTGVEFLAAPHLPSCNSFLHLFTALCWSFDAIRFGCFGLDALFNLLGVESISLIKSIRYTVGPLVFPFGAGSEMIMVYTIAREKGSIPIYIAASLWPLGFYPLMSSLLRSRRKHFQRLREEEAKKKQE